MISARFVCPLALAAAVCVASAGGLEAQVAFAVPTGKTVGTLLPSGSSPRTQPLPIIVTYEMKRLREADVASVRDPKGFWVHQVMARLEASKPSASLGLKQPATALVMFVVDRNGRITSKAIVKTSGASEADAQALAMLDRAQPFPPMPAAVPDQDLSFSLPLRFR